MSGGESESDLDDLIASWILLENDRQMLAEVHPASRLTFAVLLKFFESRGRFPRHSGEVPESAVGYLAKQVDDDTQSFEVSGRTAERFRARARRPTHVAKVTIRPTTPITEASRRG
ncbi:MAG: hypothetical protein QG622_3186 [Actinomycetota bacterium]|nr:hypothetical protein [Actinomycetota bacterium]